MTRLFRDSIEAIDSDLKEITSMLKDDMHEIVELMRKYVERKGE